MIFALYLAGYWAVVHRKVSRSGAVATGPSSSREYFVVTCVYDLSVRHDPGFRFFAPAHFLDTHIFRRRHWSGWYEVVEGATTNLIFDCDRLW